METGKIKLRHAKETDLKCIIELQAQLDRPSPKDRFEAKKFRKLVKSYIQSNYTKGNHGIILALKVQAKFIRFLMLTKINSQIIDSWHFHL
jgi:hypothetical protein